MLILLFIHVVFVKSPLNAQSERAQGALSECKRDSALTSQVFRTQRSVQFLFMGTNKISGLDENIFENMANLKQISLRENKLEKIPKSLCTNNFILQIILLDASRIKFIEKTAFENSAAYLARVNLRRNLFIDGDFYGMDIRKMKNEIGQKCVDNSSQDKLETAVKDLRKNLEIKSERIESLERKIAFPVKKQLKKSIEAIARENL